MTEELAFPRPICFPEAILELAVTVSSEKTPDPFKEINNSESGTSFISRLHNCWKNASEAIESNQKWLRTKIVASCASLSVAVLMAILASHNFENSSFSAIGGLAVLGLLVFGFLGAGLADNVIDRRKEIKNQKPNLKKIKGLFDIDIIEGMNQVIRDHNEAVSGLYDFVQLELAKNGEWENVRPDLRQLLTEKYEQLREEKNVISREADVISYLSRFDPKEKSTLFALFRDNRDIREEITEKVEHAYTTLQLEVGADDELLSAQSE